MNMRKSKRKDSDNQKHKHKPRELNISLVLLQLKLVDARINNDVDQSRHHWEHNQQRQERICLIKLELRHLTCRQVAFQKSESETQTHVEVLAGKTPGDCHFGKASLGD